MRKAYVKRMGQQVNARVYAKEDPLSLPPPTFPSIPKRKSFTFIVQKTLLPLFSLRGLPYS